MKKSKFQKVETGVIFKSTNTKNDQNKILFSVEQSKRDIVHVKLQNVKFIKPTNNRGVFSSYCVAEFHVFCIYLSYNPKDGVQRRKKVLLKLARLSEEYRKKSIPFLIVGDFNTNLDRLPTIEDFEKCRSSDKGGIKMGSYTETPMIFMTEEELPLLKSICKNTKIE